MSYLQILGLLVTAGGTLALMLGIFLAIYFTIYFKGEWRDVRRISLENKNMIDQRAEERYREAMAKL